MLPMRNSVQHSKQARGDIQTRIAGTANPEDIKKLTAEYDALGRSMGTAATANQRLNDQMGVKIKETTDMVDESALSWSDFIKKMEVDAGNSAQNINKEMQHAVDGMNDNLAKALLGQKTSWSKFLSAILLQS